MTKNNCKCTLTVSRERSTKTEYASRYYRGGATDVTWEFEDGVTIHAFETELCNTYEYRTYGRSRNNSSNYKKVRVYVDWHNGSFDVLEDLENRCRRPHTVAKPRVIEALARIGVSFDYLGWDKHAGCSMCPCSPGFVPRDTNALRGWTFYVTLPALPTVDESKPARKLVGV